MSRTLCLDWIQVILTGLDLSLYAFVLFLYDSIDLLGMACSLWLEGLDSGGVLGFGFGGSGFRKRG